MHRHVRRTFATTGTTALIAATLLTAPGAQAAAATTCQGKTVTIDGTGQATVTGTPDADVIAASLGATVTALAGDDTICVLPGAATTPTTIDAGDGNDSVDASTLPAEARVTTSLGAGDDSYTGGAASDQVSTGAGTDTVSTGAGDDGVGSGTAGQPNGDKLDLGAGDDVLDWHGTQEPSGKVEFGEGADTLADGDGGAVAIDATSSTVKRGGTTVLKWSGSVATYVVDSNATSAGFAGTTADETFVLRDPATGATPTTVDVDMAGGDDTMTVRSAVLDGSTWSGGDGTDLFQVAHDYDEVYLDLRSGQFETGEPDVTADQKVSNVENVDALSARVTVKGTSKDNVLNLQGCTMSAVGRAGADTIGYGVDIDGAPALTCTGTKLVARGGKDADRISGSSGNDRLFGNKGEDLVFAMGGDDVIFGGDDDDRLRGGAGNDKVRGGTGNDELGGNTGDDRVQGDKGNDRLLGHLGNDVLVGGLGFDRANGGKGFDKAFSVERRWNVER
jgi:Ca2+-binding RTX toxin-like protein